MIGPVKQERLDQRSIARNVSRTQAGCVGSLGKTSESKQSRVAVASERLRRRESAERWRRFVEIDLGITLVGGNQEIVTVGQLEQIAPLVLTHHPTRWIVGRAHVQQLRTRPHRLGYILPSRREMVCY